MLYEAVLALLLKRPEGACLPLLPCENTKITEKQETGPPWPWNLLAPCAQDFPVSIVYNIS